MIMPAHKASLEILQSGSEVLVHDISRSKIHVLNASAGTVLRACDGQTALDNVVRLLDPQAPTHVLEAVTRTLAEFAALGLIGE